MSQEILDKLDIVIGLLQQLLTRREKHTQRQEQSFQLDNSRSDTTLIEMVKSPEWPEAVPGDLICTESETDKQERAEGVIEMMLPQNITKFLDFGCGEGHIPEKMSQRTSLAVGYDVKQQGDKIWEQQRDNLLLTTDLHKVKTLGPYDVILIYDVFDHITTLTVDRANGMKDILEQCKSVLSPGGKVYIRTHPWTGRHGGHLYRTLNKAFVHFLLTDKELISLGAKPNYEVIRMTHPLAAYYYFIQQCGFKVEQKNVTKNIDDYFKHPVIEQRIEQIYQVAVTKGWSPDWGYDFCDFILTAF
jgi:2-polyprenyl-3-methyl-5-hydroxy-6-metoxy-1,4-benzoquinol methylase